MNIVVYHGGTEAISLPRTDVINLYMADLMPREKVLEKLSEHRPNNQMCILNQEIIDKYLIYDGAEQL